MRGYLRQPIAGPLFACACAGLTVMGAAPAAAQGSYSPYNETASAALARYVRALATDPKDFGSLIGAGRAALELGDAQAAAGFFARADDVNSRSPLPQAGMGAVSVINGDPQASFAYFSRAQQLGATLATIGCDRGLAYDLLGRQADAQSDYRAALNGPDGDEARRRLALSLAISGNKTSALQTLVPLSAKGDPTTGRVRAFVLALSGDSGGAAAAINSAMPGQSANVAPFFQRLPGLAAGQKAAAVNLGIFPDSSGTAYAYASTPPASDRLAGIDSMLRQAPSGRPAPRPAAQQPQQVRQITYALPTARPSAPSSSVAAHKIWLQLASGSNPAALSSQFDRIKSKDKELFDGITGYVARSPDRSRLVIGPFRSAGDADTFAEDLGVMNINSFKWSNSETDQIVPIGT